MPSALAKQHFAAWALLGAMFVLMLASSWNDSAIMDELAHIPGGYSYLFLKDYRLNPEHPPLIKALAAIPLVFTNVNFPTDVKSWTEDINGQWVQGAIFLYEAGNNPDAILRLMRLPLMFLAVFFGWLLWLWAKRHFGEGAALLTLFFFALSPTFIAHSRLVTTDLAAAFAFFIGIAAFIRFLRDPSPKNILLAGLAFGLAQLLKFSLVLLIPVWGILLIAWAASQTPLDWPKRFGLFFRLLAKAAAAGLVGVILIWAVYVWPVWNYPQERQYGDAEFILASFGSRPAADFDLWLIQNKFLRPLGQYFLGLFMVLQRAAGGNTQYFLGEVSAAGDWRYFPALYFLKEPLAFHILSLIALVFALRRIWQAKGKSLAAVLAWTREHFIQFSAIAFIAVYWLSSLSSTLNIGVRHVLPTFPFIYILMSKEIVAWLRPWRGAEVRNWREWLKRIYQIYVGSIPRYAALSVLLIWTASSVILAFPYYLSYYNELGGGIDNGYKIGVDSNYDWGQDLKRLAQWADKNLPAGRQIAVDYFGGGSPRYYLGDPPAGRFEPWRSAKGYPPAGGWFAVSATFQMGGYGTPVEGFFRKAEDSYEWLKPFRPVARAGKSIFIYHLP